MAKTGFWLNGAKGKVAGVTVYQSNGETVMREIKKSIKNPKTKAQLIQRIITKTVMKQYSAMKAICDHSFEGVTAGANCMARFATINNTLLRERIAKAQQEGDAFSEMYNFIPLKTAKFIPVNVQLSEGSLPQINLSNVADVASFIIGNNNTYEGALNHLGLERGDQLTFITVEGINGNYQFNFCRVILDPREEDGSAAPLSTAFIGENNNVVKPSFRNEGSFETLNYRQADGSVNFYIKSDSVVAAAVIASRKVNNEWLRSKAILATAVASFDAADYISLQEALDLAIQGTEIYTDSERYLNNAGVGGPQEITDNQIQVSINFLPYESINKGGTITMAQGATIYDIKLKGYPTNKQVVLQETGSSDVVSSTESDGVYIFDGLGDSGFPMTISDEDGLIFTIAKAQ